MMGDDWTWTWAGLVGCAVLLQDVFSKQEKESDAEQRKRTKEKEKQRRTKEMNKRKEQKKNNTPPSHPVHPL